MQPIRQSALIRHPAPSMLMQPAQQRQTTDTIVFSTQAAGSTQNSYSNSQLNGRQWCGAAFSSASNNARTSGPTVLKPPTLHPQARSSTHTVGRTSRAMHRLVRVNQSDRPFSPTAGSVNLESGRTNHTAELVTRSSHLVPVTRSS